MRVFQLFKPYFVKYKWRIVLFIMISLITSISKLFIPYLSGKFIDQLITNPTKETIFTFSKIYFFIAIFQIIFSYIITIMSVKLNTEMSFSLNKNLISHLQKIPSISLESQNTTYLNQRVNVDSNNLINFWLSFLTGVLINLISLIFSIYIILKTNFWMTVCIIILIIAYYLLYRFSKIILQKIILEQKEANDMYISSLHEQLSKIKLIKVNNLFCFFLNRLKKSFNKLLKIKIRNQKISFIFTSSDTLITVVFQIILFVFGGLMIIDGKLTIGTFSILSSYFSTIINSIKYFISTAGNYLDTLVTANRIDEILNMSTETNGKIIIDDIVKIKLDHISFNYLTKKIINNFSYEFEKGNIYILSGDNGRGKTTLVNLIIGLYVDNFDGKIQYNDCDIKKIDLYNTRNNISYTPQEDIVINDSIISNIMFDQNTNLKLEELKKLFSRFSFERFNNVKIDELWNTMINEHGSNYSGGEIKKLMLIRTFIKNSSVIILDEPSNSLDSESKKTLIKLIEEKKDDSIIIIVTHDQDLKKIADHIIEL